ncbi:MAG: cytochrome d ubiquinol oxidase subunit II [Nitrospiraceae bacterium]
MSLELMLAATILISLIFYVLTAGADFGAGVWTLFAAGERSRRQHQALIDRAIAPIWEANHVWLILVVTILFAAFPKAFALISTTLHIPLTLMLVGIVLRGSAFAFRTHDVEAHRNQNDPAQVFWMRVFGGSSVLTPLMLGLTIGTIAAGHLSMKPQSFYGSYVQPWLGPFPMTVGVFALVLFMYLAVVYLLLETSDATLQEDLRRRSLVTWLVVTVVGLVVFIASKRGAPEIYDGLVHAIAGQLTLLATFAASLASGISLLRRWYAAARVCTAFQVILILLGWAWSQYPYLVVPDLTVSDAAAPAPILELLLWSLVIGALLLFPSLYYLYRIFKAHTFTTPDS